MSDFAIERLLVAGGEPWHKHTDWLRMMHLTE